MAAIDILRSFSEEPPPFDFVLPGMLAGTVGFVLSPGGTGKSMLALEVGCAIAGSVASGASEADLLGLAPKQGKVFTSPPKILKSQSGIDFMRWESDSLAIRASRSLQI